MRNETIDVLTAYAQKNTDVMLLTADLGYSVLERYRDELPSQYVNVGVCEQAMVGIAAGLALSGHRVVLYSIANFPTLRCLEQIRNDVCYHNLPVTIVAVGGGVAYGAQGYTHHGLEDIGIMSALPHMAVTCPADPHEAQRLLPQLLDRFGPAYLRLGRSGEPILHAPEQIVEFGKAIWIREGSDVALLATGSILGRALEAADGLAVRGISTSVISFPTIKPLDVMAIEKAAQAHRAILAIEEHMIDGGFGTRVAEALIGSGRATRFAKFGVTDEIRGLIGSQSWLLDQLGAIEDHAAALL
jgi:transketolase